MVSAPLFAESCHLNPIRLYASKSGYHRYFRSVYLLSMLERYREVVATKITGIIRGILIVEIYKTIIKN
jgi:hypothetical protein